MNSHIMGGITSSSESLGDLPVVVFKTGSSLLSGDMKSMLHVVANKLKGNPTSSIDIVFYEEEHDQRINKKRTDKIIKFLTETEGISPEWLYKVQNPESTVTSANVIEFKAHE